MQNNGKEIYKKVWFTCKAVFCTLEKRVFRKYNVVIFFTLLVLFTLSLKLLDFIFSLRKLLALTVCMRNPEIPGRIQIERFIQVEISRKKVIPFEVSTVFPFLPKRQKFSVPLVWITSARLHVKRKREIYCYFVNGTTQSRFCCRCPKKYQYHLTEIFHRNFRTKGKRSINIKENFAFSPG